MAIVKGGALRLFQTFLYLINFCCAGIILGIYSYFLSVLADRKFTIPTWEKAVEGISGAAVLYTIFAVILTCCLGGVSFFAFLGLVLDILFVAGFIAIAIMTRHGASSCSGYIYTPLGNGDASDGAGGFGGDGFGEGNGGDENLTYAVRYYTACRLNTAAFAVSIIAIIFFIITAFMQIALVRHHKKEKRFGPSPANNYTSGSGKRKFWQRKPKTTATRDAELAATGGAAAGGLAAHHHNDTRPSHETGYTGSTAAGSALASDKVDGHHNHAPHGAHGGYYTQPQGTGVNPYGYENNHNTHTTGTATNY